jgi:hypothetical protein
MSIRPYNGTVNNGCRQARKGRRFAITQKRENKPQVFRRRIGSNSNPGGEAWIFAGLFHALPGVVVLPSVITAPNAIAFHPTDRELRATVGAAKLYDNGFPSSPRYKVKSSFKIRIGTDRAALSFSAT